MERRDNVVGLVGQCCCPTCGKGLIMPMIRALVSSGKTAH